MKDSVSFLKIKRSESLYRPVCERIGDFREVALLRPDNSSREQASRCMNCGTTFCHWACPLGNYIPEWNDLVCRGRWREAFMLLDATNNLPEITGRICPALCEYSCVLGINDSPVTIRENELAVIEHAFRSGFVKSVKLSKRGKRDVAVVGSGPAGLACASQLNKAGYNVTVFERDSRPGGIMRYGIPDFKLEKWILDRRLEIMKRSGITFRNSISIGRDISLCDIKKKFDALVLCCGSRVPRDLPVPGRALKGIHFALEYLIQANKNAAGLKFDEEIISARGKQVVVIGGGDTGSDCVGTCHRQGADCVVQIELFPQPPAGRTGDYPWPRYPMLLKTSTSHQEGGERQWSVMTKNFIDNGKGEVSGLNCVKVDVGKDHSGRPVIKEIPGSAFELEAGLVILALGFSHPEKEPFSGPAGLEFNPNGTVFCGQDMMTSSKGVFACGDMRRGQSLIVWAVSEGRRAAYNVDRYLRGKSSLPVF